MTTMLDSVSADLIRYYATEESHEREAPDKEDRIETIAEMAVCAPQQKDRFTCDYGIAENVRAALAEWMWELQPLVQERFAARTADERLDAAIEFFNAYEKKATEFTRDFVEDKL